MMQINRNVTRFGTPGMGQGMETVYSNIYGDNGADFVRVLQDSPYEIAVISLLLTHLEQKRKGGC